MNDPIAFIAGCIAIAFGFTIGLSYIGDGLKDLAKALSKKDEVKDANQNCPTNQAKG